MVETITLIHFQYLNFLLFSKHFRGQNITLVPFHYHNFLLFSFFFFIKNVSGQIIVLISNSFSNRALYFSFFSGTKEYMLRHWQTIPHDTNINHLFLISNVIILHLFHNKGNNKITELRTILQRESPNS